MDWVVLIASGGMEAVWALALDRAEGFTRLVPSVVFLGALAASMLGLSYAVRTIPLGTAYAVWVGIGAALTVGYGLVTGGRAVLMGQAPAHRRARGMRRGPQGGGGEPLGSPATACAGSPLG